MNVSETLSYKSVKIWFPQMGDVGDDQIFIDEGWNNNKRYECEDLTCLQNQNSNGGVK